MKYGSRKLEIGEEIRILEENDNFISAKYRGDVTIGGRFDGGFSRDCGFRQDIPKFELEDGSFKYGYECWWIPKKEGLEAEKIDVIRKIELASDVLGTLKNRGISIEDRIDILDIAIKSLHAKKRLYEKRKGGKEKCQK